MATPGSADIEADTHVRIHPGHGKKPVVRLTHLPTRTLVVRYGDTPHSVAGCRTDGLAELAQRLDSRERLLLRGLADHYGVHPPAAMPNWHPKSSRCDDSSFSCWWCGIYDPQLTAALDVPADKTGLGVFRLLMRADVRSRTELLQRFPDPDVLLDIRTMGPTRLDYLRGALELPAKPRRDAVQNDRLHAGEGDTLNATTDATTGLDFRQLRYLTRHLSPRVRLAAGLPAVPGPDDGQGLNPQWQQQVDQAAQRLDGHALRHLNADTRLDSLDLSARTLTSLHRANIRSLGDLGDTNLTVLRHLNARNRLEIAELVEIFASGTTRRETAEQDARTAESRRTPR
jgi:hypothetical protein